MSHAILSPHFDDAVLSCWMLLEGLDDVMVVNVFTGSPATGTPPPWWDRATGASDSVERMRERRAEDAVALALVSRPSMHLGLLDDQYRRADVPVQQVARKLEEHLDRGATLHAPGAFDGHADHRLVRDAALDLARLGWPLVLYADLPHATVRGWPAWLSGGHRRAGSDVATEWTRVLSEAGLETHRLVRRVHQLDPPARARKLDAIAAYRTQRAALDRFGSLPLEDPRALAWEVSWDVPASAVRGARELPGEGVVTDPSGQPLDDPI